MNALASDFRSKKRAGHRFATLTVADYAFARLMDSEGLDFLLVGDSLGMVQLGLPDTTGVTVADMVHHVTAAARGIQRTPLVADIPAGAGDSEGPILDAARALIAAGAVAVKLEGGLERQGMITALTAAGIPLVGHLGMLPQRVRIEGGYHIKGRSRIEAEGLMADARFLDEAGVIAVVLELVIPEVAEAVTASIQAPVVGIGSGPGCDGQILVTHDLVGLFPWFRPSFVKPEADLAASVQSAVRAYIQRTRAA